MISFFSYISTVTFKFYKTGSGSAKLACLCSQRLYIIFCGLWPQKTSVRSPTTNRFNEICIITVWSQNSYKPN